ncbi:MAG: hypothetical protein GY812_09700 [Actinomycetia bacterium]|nr:hypothetical protein [Actinomycetes bacterium]
MDTDSSQVRLGAIGIVAISLFLALFARLWFLQGIERQEFEATSVSNRLRVIQTEGPRGRILDRNGKVLVDNRTTIVVGLDREPLREKIRGLDDSVESDLPEIRERLSPDFEAIASALSSLGVATTPDDVWERFMDKRYSPQEPVPVAEDVSVEVEQFLTERAQDYPGVVVDRRTVREYPYGPLAAHIIGYVGEISDEELLARGGEVPGSDEVAETTTTVPGVEPKPYEAGDSIGKTGVERAYEADLRGVPGERTIEVNAKGELLDVVSDTPPQAGDDLWLTLDIDLQAHAEAELANTLEGLRDPSPDQPGRQGAVVVTDPTTAGVLAMASYPTYDLRLIVNGIPTALWDQFQDPASGLPLNNWATQGQYAPGSTFKPITALAGIQSGFLRPGNDSYADAGVYTIEGCRGGKCEFSNSGGAANGRVNLARSLTVSSNVYYYWISDQLWRGRDTYGETPIQDAAKGFGLGTRTGIDLPGEAGGRVPTPQGRKEAYEANPDLFLTGDWFVGDNLNTGVGQGDVLMTPLQLNSVYSTIANGGSVLQPHVGLQTTRAIDPTVDPGSKGNYEVVRTIEPVETGRVEIAPDRYIQIFEGLLGVTQSGEGTAVEAWQANRTAWPFAGKTGTGEVNGQEDTSVFAGWGPAVGDQAPTHSISVILPNSGFGGTYAAPLAFEVLAPASNGELPLACPVTEPERTECEEYNAEAAAVAAGEEVG